MSGYAFEDKCQNPLSVFVAFLASEFQLEVTIVKAEPVTEDFFFIQRKSKFCLFIVVSKAP